MPGGRRAPRSSGDEDFWKRFQRSRTVIRFAAENAGELRNGGASEQSGEHFHANTANLMILHTIPVPPPPAAVSLCMEMTAV